MFDDRKVVTLKTGGIYNFQGICMVMALLLMFWNAFNNENEWLWTAVVFVCYIGGTYLICHLCKSIFTFFGGIAFAAGVAGIVTWWNNPEVIGWGVFFGAGFGFFTAWRVMIGRHFEIIE